MPSKISNFQRVALFKTSYLTYDCKNIDQFMAKSKVIYHGNYLHVSEQLINNDVYELAQLRAAVVLFARNSDGEYLFIREHRPHETPNLRLKPVTGFIDDNEDWLTTAKRELREETGFTATDFKLFRHLQSTGSIRHEKFFVLVEGLTEDQNPLKNPDGDVIEEIVFLKLDQAIELTLCDEMKLTTDSLGLFLLKEMKL